MTGKYAFSNADLLLGLRKEKRDGQQKWDEINDTKIKELVAELDESNHSLILHSKNTGAWMNVQGTMVVGTVL